MTDRLNTVSARRVPGPAGFRSWQRLLLALLCVGCARQLPAATEAMKKSFDIPAGTAPATLKQFSAQAGGHLLYAADVVEGVKTNAVKGKLTNREVIDRMLTGTRLTAQQDEKTGAIAIMPVVNAKEPLDRTLDSSSIAKKKTRQP